MKSLCFSWRRAILVLCLASVLGLPLSRAMAQYTPATAAFDNSPVCSDSDLHRDTDLARGNPEWKPVNGLTVDPQHLAVHDEPVILEGVVIHPPGNESPTDQSTAEVAEEDIPWNHYTHDFTFKVAPDLPFQYLLSSWARYPGQTFPGLNADQCSLLGGTYNGTTCVLKAPEVCPDGSMGDTCHHSDMEVEWENASAMKINDDDDRTWGGLPEFAWPAPGDRVWVVGRWIFDCGHPGTDTGEKAYVKFGTEIHPPRAVAAIRVNHTGLSSLGANFTESWLPVTGAPTINIFGKPSSDPTHVPITEADVFVSGNGGGANDLCALTATDRDNNCQFRNTDMDHPNGHTNPVIPVNDRNYVFDIYPPGTNYGALLNNSTFLVQPPSPYASLQWRVVDQSAQVPAHVCNSDVTIPCTPIEPIFCLVDESTPPPDPTTNQADTNCPTLVSQQAKRLRVILPFSTRNPNVYFAKSILLGWDDVPTTIPIRTFRITLHEYDVVHNDEFLFSGDWRVFVSVGGQWRYMSPLSDGYPDNNPCHGDQLTSSGDGDCFQFENTPWIVSVRDREPIHVAVGGFDSDNVDSDFCGANDDNRAKYPNGCDPFGGGDEAALVFTNDDRLGTYEFDLVSSNNYAPPAPYLVVKAPDFCIRLFFAATCDLILYAVEFHVREIVSPPVDPSFPLQIGNPHSSNYVTSATPLILTAAHRDYQGFQYRFHPQGGPLPTYASTLEFPVHWTSVDLPGTSQSVSVYDNFGNPADGPYDLQYSAETSAHQLEPRNTASVILDNTPPVATITQPTATQYVHSATLALGYTVSDGTGSGVQSSTPTMDGLAKLKDGTPVANNLAIHLLTALSLGTHTFSVNSLDNVNNAGTQSVTFSVIVTSDSIKQDIKQFLQSGAIKNIGIAISLLAKLDVAGAARDRGRCSTAANLYRAFINELQAQSGKHVDPTAAQIMILDAQYLIAHCP
ncbi:MAG: hypothetical protein LAO06_13250 [Acidobacteriia bacterium]|nr:hypothetical protein [Terriglobia bacterium]